MPRSLLFSSAVLALALLPRGATAAELVWDGYYRSRARFFDSLSLSNTNTYAEGASAWWDHRLRLQPGFLISSNVGIHVQIDGLLGVPWGDEVATEDPLTGDALPVAWSQEVGPPTTDEGGTTSQNLRLTRAWGEVSSSIGTFRFGRLPVHWGSGMVWNAGNDPDDEYGDTADRLQITSRVGPVYVFGAYELPFEGFVSEHDDVSALVAGVLYQSEVASLGTYNVYRWSKYDDSKYGAYIGDIWGRAELGPAVIETEVAAVLGGGDLDTGANDIRVASFGAQLSADLTSDKLIFGLGAGFAGGDGDSSDSRIRSFSFDKDFNVALILFEEPLPTLQSTVLNDSNGGRNYDAARTWDGVSNALYIRPHGGYQLRDDLVADVSLIAAQAAKVDADQSTAKGYGLEIDAGLQYTPFEHLSVQAAGGVFMPGKYFSEYEDESYGSGFDRTVFAGRLMGTVSF